MNESINVVRKFIDEYQTGGNEAVGEALIAPDFVDHTPFPGFGPTRGDVFQLFRVLPGAFPDLRAEIIEQFADRDRVVTRKTFHGTHQGPFAECDATGNQVSIRVVDIVQIAGGQITEHWNLVDLPGLMRQLQPSSACLPASG